MNAREVMTSPVISATANAPVRDIAQLLLKNHISAVPILDYSGAPIGMVSEGDLIGRRNAQREWWLALLAEGESLSSDFLSGLRRPERVAIEIMSKPVVTVGEDTDAAEIARLLTTYRCATGGWSESSAVRIYCGGWRMKRTHDVKPKEELSRAL